ncbi:MAG: CDP-alcohol phosphatidyltransferase family protein [Hyphomicrobiales bacterium]
MASADNSVLSQLRRQWAFLGVIGGGCLAGGAAVLVALLGAQPAARWSFQASLALAYVLLRLRGALGLNHRADDPKLRPSLGAANLITLVRAMLTACLAGFLFQVLPIGGGPAWSWPPGLLYLAAAVMDFADGYIARVTGTVTRLGEFLDTEVDALGLVVASLLLVSSGRAPLPYLWVGFGYYGLQAAIRLRHAAGQPTTRVAPRAGARWTAGCEMGFAAAALLPAFGPDATRPAAWVMAMGLFVSLGQDWLVVCGHATPEGRPLGRGLKILDRALAGFLPIIVRAAVAAGATLTLWRWPAVAGMPLSSVVLQAVFLATGALCTLGVAARCAAMLLSLVIAAWLIPAAPGIISSGMLAAVLILMLTGAGHPRLCQPEDRFLMTRQGKKGGPQWKKRIAKEAVAQKASTPWTP